MGFNTTSLCTRINTYSMREYSDYLSHLAKASEIESSTKSKPISSGRRSSSRGMAWAQK